MNVLKKMYCRTFQTALRLSLPFLPYRTPEIIDRVENLPEVLHSKSLTRVLIVTDEGITKLGLLQTLTNALQAGDIRYTVYDRTVANPTTKNVQEAVALYRSNHCQALIGMGGGSSIDCAKAVGAVIAKPKQPISKMKGILKILKKIPTLIAIPTTAGTGSETTLAAVITDADTRHKYAINDFPLIPSYAVLEPKFTLSLPQSLTATTGMDALTHAVEAYIGKSTTTDTRKSALTAVKLIFENLDTAYHDGSNETARKNMLIAAYEAGCAFTKSYVGYVHAVAHSLGGEYNVPHGLANAILLPFVLEAYGSSIHEKLRQLAIAAGIATKDTPAKQAANDFIQAIQEMKKRYCIPDTVPQLRREDIGKLARYADKEANPLYPVPVLMDANELAQFYERLIPR